MIAKLKKMIGNRSPLRLGWHALKALMAALYYRFPARKLTIIGITGTDGKTTSVGMLAHILHNEGIAVAALSTAFFRIKDQIEWNTTEKTSPSPFVIQQFLHRAAQAGCTHVVLEVSSHGLVQHRLDYTWPRYSAITNVDQEHLDYHGTMQQYIRDKGLLFRTYTQRGGTVVLNCTDQSFTEYKTYKHASKVLYSLQTNVPADVVLSNVRTTPAGSKAQVHVLGTSHECELQLLGEFNQYNATCVLALCEAMNVSIPNALQHLRSFTNGPARLQKVEEGQNYLVFIDFAITPQAFTATLSALKQILQQDGKLIVVTGSCGDRMREKRPLIGTICCEYASVFIVTDDEPYTEDPERIRKEVLAGADSTHCQVLEIADRTEAIHKAMELAEGNDIVLLAGLGSYPSRMFAEGPRPWDELQTAKDAIAASES